MYVAPSTQAYQLGHTLVSLLQIHHIQLEMLKMLGEVEVEFRVVTSVTVNV